MAFAQAFLVVAAAAQLAAADEEEARPEAASRTPGSRAAAVGSPEDSPDNPADTLATTLSALCDARKVERGRSDDCDAEGEAHTARARARL